MRAGFRKFTPDETERIRQLLARRDISVAGMARAMRIGYYRLYNPIFRDKACRANVYDRINEFVAKIEGGAQ